MIHAAHYHIARKRTAPLWALAGALLVLGTVCAGLRIVASRHAVAATVQPGIMAGLVVRGHHQAVAATLDGGMRIHGALYPALPGVNALDLTLRGAARGVDAVGPGTLELNVVMPGMAMRPVRVTLRGRNGRYWGNLALPMFGRYVARVVLVTPRGHWRGTMNLAVPLTLSP
jgi:hypothetical protein